MSSSDHIISGEIGCGTQYHFHMETHVSKANFSFHTIKRVADYVHISIPLDLQCTGRCVHSRRGRLHCVQLQSVHQTNTECCCSCDRSTSKQVKLTCVLLFIPVHIGFFSCFGSVNVSVKRVGGSFGGKITRCHQAAAACGLAAHLTRR